MSEQTATKKQNPFSRLIQTSIWLKLFALLLSALLIFGLLTLGSAKSFGKSAKIADGSTAITYRVKESGKRVSAIYMNIGAVYGEIGGESTTTTTSVRMAYSSDGNSFVNIGSVHHVSALTTTASSEFYHGEANWNWVEIVCEKNYSYEYYRLTFPTYSTACRVNEVVFLDSDGNPLKMTVDSALTTSISREEALKTVDKPSSFTTGETSFYRFTPNEQYVLYSIDGAFDNKMDDEYNYPASTDFGSLGYLVYGFSVLVFGVSPFALRLPSFLSTVGVYILLFLLGKRAFKGDKWGFVLSSLFLLSGIPFTLGRVGAPFALGIFFTVLAIDLMYRFFAKGISMKAPVRTALPVFLSGTSVALAVLTEANLFLPALAATLILFGAGMLRLYEYKRVCVAKAEAVVLTAYNGKSVTGEELSAAKREATATARSEYAYKLRLSIGFILLSLVTFILLALLTTLAMQGSLARYYGLENGFLKFLSFSLSGSFTVTDVTKFTSNNASSPLSWLLSLQAATLFGEIGDTTANVWAVNNNFILNFLALPALVFSLVRVIVGVVRSEEDKVFLRGFRAFILLFIGLLFSLVAAITVEGASVLYSGLLEVFLISFIALAFYFLQGNKTEGKGLLAVNLSLLAVAVVSAVILGLTMPLYLGAEVSAEYAKTVYNLASFLYNGMIGAVK